MRIHYCECTKTVPQIVEGINCARTGQSRLVLEGNKRAAQLYGVRQIFVDKSLRELKHVGGCNLRHPILHLNLVAKDKTVCSHYHLVLRVPYQQLLARLVHCVELIDIATKPSATSGMAECNLAQTAYLAHHIRRIVGIYNVNLVAALVGVTQKPFRGEFPL